MTKNIEGMMSKYVQYVDCNSTVVDAARIMDDTDLAFLIVKNVSGQVSGVLSATDIIEKIVATEKNPANVTVQEIMTQTYIYIDRQNDSIDNVAAKLKKYKLRRLPVIDNGKVIGVISSTDLLKHIIQENKENLFDLAKEF